MAGDELKDFFVVNDELYHRGNGGMLATAFSLTEVKEELR